MANPWDKFLNSDMQADLVAGQLIARIDGVHTILGQVNMGQLILTEEGQAASDALEATPKRVRGKAAAVAADPAPEPDADQGQALALNLTDDVTVTEQMTSGVETPADAG